jgi:transposase-like protein
VTIALIADDLGVNRETLRSWVRADDQRRGGGSDQRRPAAVTSEAVGSAEQENAELRRRVREPEEERYILEGRPVFRRGDALATRFQFVADHQARYGVKRLCQILKIARSSYYCWKATAPVRAARDAADQGLGARIRAVQTANDGSYGVPRIIAELHDDGLAGNHKKVARVMRRHRIAGLRLRWRVQTAIADPAASKASDLIGRDFIAAAVNQRYLGDIT